MGHTSVIEKLFDFKFDHSISKTVIKVLYVTWVVLMTIAFIVLTFLFVIERFLASNAALLIIYSRTLLLLRLFVENWLVRFQMAQDVKEIRATFAAVRETSATNSLFKKFNGYQIQHLAILTGADMTNANLIRAIMTH